jgi:hypothetical protein
MQMHVKRHFNEDIKWENFLLFHLEIETPALTFNAIEANFLRVTVQHVTNKKTTTDSEVGH